LASIIRRSFPRPGDQPPVAQVEQGMLLSGMTSRTCSNTWSASVM
jgi:hypothetical protein